MPSDHRVFDSISLGSLSCIKSKKSSAYFLDRFTRISNCYEFVWEANLPENVEHFLKVLIELKAKLVFRFLIY